MENEKGYQILQQVPLIKAPFASAPKPVKLSPDYIQLPSRVPETRLQREDLESWITECKSVQSDIRNYGKDDVQSYDNWHDRVVKKMAPGYIGASSTVLIPQRKTVETLHDSMSSLDIK